MVEKVPSTLRGRVERLQSVKKYAALTASHAQASAKAERASQLAVTDALTGLPNLLAFELATKEAEDKIRTNGTLNLHRRKGDALDDTTKDRIQYALLFVDLDRFKQINDRHGHPVGNEALHQAVKSMKNAVRNDDFIARIGGDEFVVLLTLPVDGSSTIDDMIDIGGKGAQTKDPMDIVSSLAEKIRHTIDANPLILNDEKRTVIPLSSSIGGALLQDGQTFEQMKANADFALYKAKGEAKYNGVTLTAEGEPKNRVALFIPGLPEPILNENYQKAPKSGISFNAPRLSGQDDSGVLVTRAMTKGPSSSGKQPTSALH